MPDRSTIAAISTGTGGGVGMVRISGPGAEQIGRALCSPWPTPLESHRLYLGAVRDSGGRRIDQVMFVFMRSPRSYTGEDVLELHGHGGGVNLALLLQAVLAAGAEVAGPGEFTRRAFLAGKLDLSQAEAIASLIDAQSVLAARQAQRQLRGELGQRITEHRRRVLRILGELEGALDFPDLELDEDQGQTAAQELAELHLGLQALSQGFSQGGKALSAGIEVALLGPTNAGKSSLINALCRSERVIVDARPGTTRDYVEVRTSWDGIPVTLIDTAGERQDATELEREGLRLGRERWRHADLLVLVVDGCAGLSDRERELIEELPGGRAWLVAWNQIDRVGCLPPQLEEDKIIRCSALCGWGVSELQRRALTLLAPNSQEDSLLVTNSRHAAALALATETLLRTKELVRTGATWDLAAAELRACVRLLGEITGEDVSADVVESIFTRFCIGK